MAKVGGAGGFDPSLGIQPVYEGREEIGHINLPGAARVIPASVGGPEGMDSAAPVYGKLSDSALLDRLAAYASPEIAHRELLEPDVFFATLSEAADEFVDAAQKSKQPGGGPLAEAANELARVLGDRELCDLLRRLVLKS